MTGVERSKEFRLSGALGPATQTLFVTIRARFANNTSSGLRALAARIAVAVGLLSILVSGYIGYDMAAVGEAAVAATGQPPETITFGAAGSAKLAHALGMHGLQVLGLLAIGLGLDPLPIRNQVRLMVLGAAGYASVFVAVTATAYAGRAWTSPTAPMALLAVAGVGAVLAACGIMAARLLPGVAGRRRASVVELAP